MTPNTMKVEIWSDIMCPFCYIGKRNFDKALEQFSHRDRIEVIWKSFSLAPDLKTDASIHSKQYLQDRKGMSAEQAQNAIDHVTDYAKATGLDFDYDKVIVANTHKGHQLIHLAGQQGLQDAMKERLLKAYFIDGLNVDDTNVLVQLGVEVGLTEEAIHTELREENFAAFIEQDIAEAQQLGVSGVPFFVFDRKYAVSGAQPEEQFSEVIDKAYSEWHAKHNSLEFEVMQGQSCDADGNCD
ncbi:DsbA family oxidoreductase [Leeuwenhoekiella sp. MAR_2009_132]|uniref:DsbA family oxidoreductase n=1 Tax=Leeuwenhoekiella sp. MAR_2009_132 TaxID=1392489 RepID=UPI00048F1CE8|nr:DsbA family oxidoreductase [Leeuwenhoekiella sp. MAR_2009_132]